MPTIKRQITLSKFAMDEKKIRSHFYDRFGYVWIQYSLLYSTLQIVWITRGQLLPPFSQTKLNISTATETNWVRQFWNSCELLHSFHCNRIPWTLTKRLKIRLILQAGYVSTKPITSSGWWRSSYSPALTNSSSSSLLWDIVLLFSHHWHFQHHFLLLLWKCA